MQGIVNKAMHKYDDDAGAETDKSSIGFQNAFLECSREDERY